MRKNMFKLVGLMIFSTIAFVACNKGEIRTAGINSYEDFRKTSNHYILNNESELLADRDERVRKWRNALRITGEDLKGAVSGAGTGAAAGSIIPGVGTATGAIIGGVVMGAGASMVAAAKDPTSPKSKNSFLPTLNPLNEYDVAGINHYGIINEALLDESNYLDGSGDFSHFNFYNFSRYYLNNNTSYSEQEVNVIEYPDYQLGMGIIAADNEEVLADFLNKLDNISNSVESYLYLYFKAFESSKTIHDFVNYSLTVESIIINSDLNKLEKYQLLGTMSTARIGIQYWGE